VIQDHKQRGIAALLRLIVAHVVREGPLQITGTEMAAAQKRRLIITLTHQASVEITSIKTDQSGLTIKGPAVAQKWFDDWCRSCKIDEDQR
jgi:hypothetical protein